jgi:hypothetical protein
MPITGKQDLDGFVKTNDGKYLIFECKNINTKHIPYTEKAGIIQALPKRRYKTQRRFHVNIEKYVLIITNCLNSTAKDWLKQIDIPIIEIGDQITYDNRIERTDEIVKILEPAIINLLMST